ncbi:hypothetical protein GCM10011363_45330 [Marivita lacus]|uniref:DUF4214 domain-containing protein n=1 Tax=Marivita lacus TaxID=1323742 RepID=A0ABQ1LFC3_9RHOB|nr:DUF4214 domain-containing protein [Marivita lacus]GGC23724.1 hypothetical protein GCM10011363_45330 [Marivita lacus]
MSNSTPVGPLVILGDALIGETLIARPNGIADADGINYSTQAFQWLRNGDPIFGATQQSYLVSSMDTGSEISVRYSYTDNGGTLEVITSKPEPAVSGTAPTTSPIVSAPVLDPGIVNPNNSDPVGPLVILGDALVGETLIARPNGIADADGINFGSASFQWLRDGTPISGATAQTYLVGTADRGAQLSVQWTYLDNGGSRETITSKPEAAVPGGTTPPPAETPVPETPVTEDPVETPTQPPEFMNSVPIGKLVILGFPVEGADLLARTDAVFDRDGFDPADARFQWFRGADAIEGATDNIYRITEDDRGESISVQMSFVDGAGTLETVVSEPEPPVPDPNAPETPELSDGTGQPRATGVLEGTPANDAALTAVAGIGRIDGLDGVDTAAFAGNQTNYTMTFSPDGVTVTDRTDGGLGTIALDNVELIDFGTDLPVFGGAMDLRQFGGHTTLDAAAFESFVEMYIAYFNRAPDAVGLAFWGTAHANGMSLEAIAAEFATQPETLATYPEGSNNLKFVSDVYGNVLGRSPDIDGLRFWAAQLDDANVTRGEFILAILNGVQDGSEDRAYLDQKTDLGALFAVHRGMSNTDDAAQVMSLFDGSAESLGDAVDAVEVLYMAAMSAENGDFLMPLLGVLDDFSAM